MSFELRAITDDEVPTFRAVMAMGFGHDYKPEGDERFRSMMPLERTVAAYDGDDLVATLGDFPLQLTVPGGVQVDMAGTTMVTVQATHTRQGILRSMIRRHLDNAVERGEPVAGLWASEPGIYGRFGFGMSTECHYVNIDSRHMAKPAVAEGVQLAMLPAEQIHDVVAPYWHQVATERAGFIDRGAPRWQDIINDPEPNREGGSAARHIIARRDGQVVGYLAYRQHAKWDDFVATGGVAINALVASDVEAHISLWAYALDVDLFPNVSFWDGAIDDPLAYHVRDARAIKRSVADALYVRILNVESALTSRDYERDGQVVFTVTDDMGYADGTFQLTVVDGQASIESTTSQAEVTMGVRELGALYLGRVCADLYTSTGDITGDLDAIRTIGQLFATARAPWCPEMF